MPLTNGIYDSVFRGTSQHEERRQNFVKSGWLVSIPLSIIRAHQLLQGEQRLDAEYYAAKAIAATRAVYEGGAAYGTGREVKPLKELTRPIYYPGRFKRIYAKTKTDGKPFLTASEMLHFRPISEEFLANNTNYVDKCSVEPNWILVTRSGTVGRCVLVGKRLSQFAISDDALRVQANDVPVGYIYSYLSSWIGQALIVKDQYGAAIKHLEPHHLAGVPIPLVDKKTQQDIHNQILKAYKLRDEANDLLDEADELLHRELGLPIFDESLVPYLPEPKQEKTNRPSIPHPRAFTANANELNNRFDGSYHVPIAKTAIRLMKDGKYELALLENLAKDIIVAPRFKRIYVAKEYGIPFLQGSHLPQMRPTDIKYLSVSQQANIERWIIEKGWVLVTCSGTIGRIGLVSSRRDKWAASQHILRILPDYLKGHPGYIAAFLSTPYGQHQIISKTYGGVIDEITAEDTGKIWIPDAPIKIQERIGELVVSAYEKKDEASEVEEDAIRRIETILQK